MSPAISDDDRLDYDLDEDDGGRVLRRRRWQRLIWVLHAMILMGLVGFALWAGGQRLPFVTVYEGHDRFYPGDKAMIRVQAFRVPENTPIADPRLRVDLLEPGQTADDPRAYSLLPEKPADQGATYVLGRIQLPINSKPGQYKLRLTTATPLGEERLLVPIEIVAPPTPLNRAKLVRAPSTGERAAKAKPRLLRFGEDSVQLVIIPGNGRLVPDIKQTLTFWASRVSPADPAKDGLGVADLMIELTPAKGSPQPIDQLRTITDGVGLATVEYLPRFGGENLQITVSRGKPGEGKTWWEALRRREEAIEAAKKAPKATAEEEKRKAWALKVPELRTGADPQTFEHSFTPMGQGVHLIAHDPFPAPESRPEFEFRVTLPGKPYYIDIFRRGTWAVSRADKMPAERQRFPFLFEGDFRGFVQVQVSDSFSGDSSAFDAVTLWIDAQRNPRQRLDGLFRMFKEDSGQPLAEALGAVEVTRWLKWVDATTRSPGYQKDDADLNHRMAQLLLLDLPKDFNVPPILIRSADGLKSRGDIRQPPLGLPIDDPTWVGQVTAFKRKMEEQRQWALWGLIGNAVLAILVLLWQLYGAISERQAIQARMRSDAAGFDEDEIQAVSSGKGHVAWSLAVIVGISLFYAGLIWFVTRAQPDLSGWTLRY